MNAILLAAFAALAHAAGPAPQTLPLHDAARERDVPVLVYGAVRGRPRPLALISHGYGGQAGSYAFIAEALVARGYVVASVQHEIDGDAPMPAQGEPAIVRRPFWARGVENLRFAIGVLRARGLASRSPVLLVGHSNGGDTAMLFATQRPAEVRAAFSLDNRRMALPRAARPRICSARSSDQPADPGVLPDAAEQRRLRMVIAAVPVIHNDMGDGATRAQKQAMLAVLERCLSRP